jgi:hypothetical protein
MLNKHEDESTQHDRTRDDSLALQAEISRILWDYYAVGDELVGRGDVEGAKAALRNCFLPDMKFELIMPPAHAHLSVTTVGADGFADTANGFYRALDFVHVQHLVSNVVVRKTGPKTASVNAAAFAIHVYRNGGALNANVSYDIDFVRVGDKWMMAHVKMPIHSATEVPAWVPPPGMQRN